MPDDALKIAIITGAGQILAGLITSLRGIGEDAKATALENTLKADDHWRQVLADPPAAPQE
jgi:hypothetical protein